MVVWWWRWRCNGGGVGRWVAVVGWGLWDGRQGGDKGWVGGKGWKGRRAGTVDGRRMGSGGTAGRGGEAGRPCTPRDRNGGGCMRPAAAAPLPSWGQQPWVKDQGTPTRPYTIPAPPALHLHVCAPPLPTPLDCPWRGPCPALPTCHGDPVSCAALPCDGVAEHHHRHERRDDALRIAQHLARAAAAAVAGMDDG